MKKITDKETEFDALHSPSVISSTPTPHTNFQIPHPRRLRVTTNAAAPTPPPTLSTKPIISDPSSSLPTQKPGNGLRRAPSPPAETASSSLFDWSDFLDFNLDETLDFSFPQPEPGSGPEFDRSQPLENSGRVRKRDPRLVCSNFLAGRVPCACPELDEQLAEEESALPGKKRARMVRVSGGAPVRCQVPGCEVDITELKGYHKRHRVCLRCANASAVVLDGESKRYCQQCGKFHLLSDFDEGKRSCRRKLERHNNRRRRRPSDSRGGMQKEAQQISLADDVSGDDDTGKDGICPRSQTEEQELLLESDAPASTLCSALDPQNPQSDSVASFAASDKMHISGQTQNPKYKHSPPYCDNKNTFSSMCPAGRISFKLYDWNPAEFPRRLRHQIFQWLANMPIELEGYIRPGCTILTAFFAMPKSTWVKLLEEPTQCIKELLASPGNILSGRGTMLVYLNDMMFRVTKDANSVVKIKVKDRSPKLHYIYPTCFEAGKPMEFVACGSYLLQPKFRFQKPMSLLSIFHPEGDGRGKDRRSRFFEIMKSVVETADHSEQGSLGKGWFLVSFAGRYLAYNICVSSPCCKKGERNTSGHQLVKISVPQTDMNYLGPAFIEVENQSGLSNFIPVLVGDKETCAEMEILQQKFDSSVSSQDQQQSPPRPECEVFASRQAQFSEFVLDVAWSLKKPIPEQQLTSSHIQRFNNLLNCLIEKESSVILERVLCNMKSAMGNNLVDHISDADMSLLRKNMGTAQSMLDRKLQEKDVAATSVLDGNAYSQSFQKDNKYAVLAANTGAHETSPLLNGEVIMNVSLQPSPQKSCNRLLTRTSLPSRTLIMAIAVLGICVGVCAVVLHPQRVSDIATTIRSTLRSDIRLVY
ncbi:UNVERIFIED_CONTAM: Squamosa promoter-binding-like protein 7 [Sesamum calycinum]|uniref:Squamosa promoter-binding-like protein 7 n=1 Tax=Sesamum calycinum TaxID=2727403 RepID=A0AAW2R937_9LAMI